jgi:ATP-dependent DNA ligase
VAFDLLIADGTDLRPLPLRQRKAVLARVGKGAENWIALTNGIVGEGRALYRAVVEADLEGIVVIWMLGVPQAAIDPMDHA